MPEYYKVSYIVLFTKNEDRIHGMKHFLCAWLTGSDSQKTSDVMDHAILSIVIAYSVINDCM